MKVKVLLFAAVRERIGQPELILEFAHPASVLDLLSRLKSEYPQIAGLLSVCRVAVDSEYATPQHPLLEGNEIAIIPPVSGGSEPASAVLHVRIVRGPIEMRDLASKVSSPGCGAALTFAGTVRLDVRSDQASVARITYEGYEQMAEHVLRKIAEAAANKYNVRVAVEHRLGTLNVGEISVGIAVAGPHRADGFSALREIIETIKHDLPIWKKEEFSDGSAQWVDCRLDQH